MKPYEAMGMEKAVVVSIVAAQAEMVIDGTTGLVFTKGSVDELADRLELLVTDRELARKLGAQSRKWVLENRTWRHSAEIVNEVYRDVADNGPRVSIRGGT